MHPDIARNRILPILKEHFGVAAEFLLDDVLAGIPIGPAYDPTSFIQAFEAALAKELPPGVAGGPIFKAIRKALYAH